MHTPFASKLTSFRTLPLITLLALASAAACSSDDDDSAAAGGTSGSGGKTGGAAAQGGSSSVAGSGAVAGSTPATGGTSGDAGSTSVAGASDGGAAEGGAAGSGGDAGEGGAAAACVFHTDAPDGSDGAGGAGGGPADDLVLRKSNTIGPYLTDAEGHALYIFGSDVPGDCNTPPVSACLGAPCTQTWSSFAAETRVLGPGLDDAQFGDFTLPTAGTPTQTTYHGWPLYRYVDEAPGSLSGQGIAGLWHAVKAPFFNVMLMKKKLSDTVTAKYISDGEGYAIYRSSADPASEAGKPAVSNCLGDCSKEWPPFTLDRFILPSSYAASDFSVFARSDGKLQVAYRGAPLYRYRADLKPGDTLGQGVGSFTLADPAL